MAYRLSLLALGVSIIYLAIGIYWQGDDGIRENIGASQVEYEEGAEKTAKALAHSAPRGPVTPSEDASRAEYLKAYSRGSLGFWEARRSVHRDKLREELLSALYTENPDYFAYASSATLIDPNFLKDNFGRNQSLARMFAIECMVYLLKLKNYDIVIATIGGVSKLHRNDDGFPRVDLDLENLIYEYVKANPDRFYETYEIQLATMGLDVKNRMIFSDSVLMALRGKPEYSSELSDFIHE